jgi:NAD(P)-dependent dehydrogenase (short-subunit alcohol dehydrogenase family)
MKTVMITGCSSGFGLEIARHFLERDWHVVATMRTPRTDLLPASDRLRIVALDVTDAVRPSPRRVRSTRSSTMPVSA